MGRQAKLKRACLCRTALSKGSTQAAHASCAVYGFLHRLRPYLRESAFLPRPANLELFSLNRLIFIKHDDKAKRPLTAYKLKSGSAFYAGAAAWIAAPAPAEIPEQMRFPLFCKRDYCFFTSKFLFGLNAD